MLPFIIAGLTTGSVYGLAAVGLVLTYKTSGVFNFAHGALATVSAYTFYTLHVQHGMPWGWAAAICVIGIGVVVGSAFEFIARSLLHGSLATRVACTVGLLLIVQATVTIIYGTATTRTVPEFLPRHTFNVGSAVISSAQVIIFVIGVAATGALYTFFRMARLGVAMRAVVDNSELVDIAGTSPARVRRLAWIIGIAFACACGVLLISIPPPPALDPLNLTFLVVAAYGAAAIGSFRSLPLSYVGGLAIGVAASICTKYFTHGFLSGVSVSMPFLVLFVVLLVSPRRRLADRSPIVVRGVAAWTAPGLAQTALGAGMIVLLVFVPSFAGFHLQDYSRALALTVLFLSLGLLTRTSGQVSLAHVSFMAIGVCAFSQLHEDHRWPWLIALLAAGLITMPIGALLAVPAIRLSGLYLALATFGFGILLQYMFYSQGYMFGNLGLGVNVSRPKLSFLTIDSDKGYYYLVLVIATICTVGVIALTRSRIGRLLRALSDSPAGLATSGTSVNVTRILIFCISAFIAAIAGVLEAGALAAGGVASVSGDSYQPITSLIFFTLIVITIGGAPWYALAAAFGYALVPSYFTGSNTSNWLTLAFGISAVLYSLSPPGAARAPKWLDNICEPLRLKRSPTVSDVMYETEVVKAGGLKVEALRVAFGGLVAVDGVTFEAPTGRITGLIGPNGAGKTTTFNACSGLNRPSRGRVEFDGVNVSRMAPAARARRGLGRTFQQMELFDNLTVRENVAVGREASFAGRNPLAHLASSRAQARVTRAATDYALKQCDLEPIADAVVGSLSTGQRRLVELARCLAGPQRLLLLDEPSSGLDRVETRRFGEILRLVVRERGVGVLLVEHDMSLVSAVSDYIYVLDFGRLIYEGSPELVMSAAEVRAAYLGNDLPGEREPASRGDGAADEQTGAVSR